jgi:hypothetical protein
MELSDAIVPSESNPVFLSTKIELKLKKAVSGKQWKTLEETGEKSSAKQIPQTKTSKKRFSKYSLRNSCCAAEKELGQNCRRSGKNRKSRRRRSFK